MTETQDGLRRSFPIMTVAVTSLGFALVQLDGSILNIALSQIGTSLRTGINDLQWTVDAYFVAFAVLLLSAGALSDRWGARRTFVSGFIVFSAASLACGVAPNMAPLIAARAVQGVGAATTGAVLMDPPQRRLWERCGRASTSGRPLDGSRRSGDRSGSDPGWIADRVSRLEEHLLRQCADRYGRYLVDAALPRSTQACAPMRRGLDLTGQTLVAVALLGLVGAIIEAGPSGWHSPLVLSGIILAVTSGMGFIIVEWKASDPAVPIDLFRNMEVSTTMLVGFAVHSLMIGVTFGFALYFQRVLSFSTVETGVAFLPFALMIIAANVVGGRCVARFGLRGPMCIGLVIAAAGCALLLGSNHDRSYWAILPGQLLIRLGIGLVVPAITTGMLAAVPSARSGVASGALNATRQTGVRSAWHYSEP